MDLQSLYYFSELAKNLHFTRTAEKLFISQQTLSNHIARLEDYYGTPLFYRRPKLSLTFAGEQVLRFSQELTRQHENLHDILSEITKEQQGLIRFGASTLRMSTSLPDILPAFSEKFPKVEIRLTDARAAQLEQLLLEGNLDLAIAVTEEINPLLTATPLMDDKIYFCVSDSLLEKYYGEQMQELKEKARNGVNFHDFSRLPFCMLNNRIGQYIQQCFDDIGFTPRVFTTSAFVQITNTIGAKGIAAFFATRNSLLNMKSLHSGKINIFPLYYKDNPLLMHVMMLHHKDRYLSSYSRYFLSLFVDYFQKVESLPIHQLIASDF